MHVESLVGTRLQTPSDPAPPLLLGCGGTTRRSTSGYRDHAPPLSRRWLAAAASTTPPTDGTATKIAMPVDELNKRLDTFQDLFVEARLCIEDVVDAAETTYFDDDVATAQTAVDAAVAEFTAILRDLLDVDQRNSILRTNGLKVEQLKGELEMAIKGGGH